MRNPLFKYCQLLLLATLSFSNASWAKSVYSVGLMDKYPWSYVDIQGNISGIFPSFLDYAAQQSRGEFEFGYRILPIVRILRSIDKPSSIDFTFVSFKHRRTDHMLPIVALYQTPFVVLSANKNPIYQLTQLENKRVTSLIGGSGCPCIFNEGYFQLVKLERHSQALKMLEKGRVDAVSGPGLRLSNIAAELGMTQKLAPELIYEWRTMWLWAARHLQGSEQLEQISALLNSSQSKVFFQQLIVDHLNTRQRKYIQPITVENLDSDINYLSESELK